MTLLPPTPSEKLRGDALDRLAGLVYRIDAAGDADHAFALKDTEGRFKFSPTEKMRQDSAGTWVAPVVKEADGAWAPYQALSADELEAKVVGLTQAAPKGSHGRFRGGSGF